ncbi:MAG: hypothetical protein HQ568_12215 [Calditrichaeota bacterium]|nr:hypothetical protein [Calditrichota bacterium]
MKKSHLSLVIWIAGYLLPLHGSAQTPQAEPGFKLPFHGSLSSRYSHEDINSQIRNVATLDGNLSGYGDNLRWVGQFHLTSLSSEGLQSQNRFSGMLNYKRWTFKLGDTSPRLSQLTLAGIRNRGFEVSYRGSHFNLDVAAGNPLRAVEGSERTITVEDINGEILKSRVNPLLDSTRVMIFPGTCRRWLLAVRPGYSHPKYGEINLNLLKIRDQVQSIKHSYTPKDNLVLGIDYGNYFFDKRLRFTTETALSLYNSDIGQGPMSSAAGVKELVIVVNQYLEPLPANSDIAKKDLSDFELFRIVFAELIESAMAHQSSLTLYLPQNEVRLDYKTIGRSFHSLGSPSVQTDIKGFSISDRVRLFDNKIYLNIRYDSYQDNVNNRKPAEESVHRRSFSGGVSYYTPQTYPNYNFNLRVYSRENDAEINTVELPDGTKALVGNQIDNQTYSYDFSIDQAFPFYGFNHNASLSYNLSKSKDKLSPDQASDLSSINVQVSSWQESKLNTTVSFSIANQNSLGNTNETDYKTIATSGRYTVSPQLLWLSGGLNLTFADGGLTTELDDTTFSPSGYALDFNRLEFSIGCDARINNHHDIGLVLSKVSHSDNGYIEEWTWSSGSWTSTRTSNKDSDSYIRQNDFTVRLHYKYTF